MAREILNVAQPSDWQALEGDVRVTLPLAVLSKTARIVVTADGWGTAGRAQAAIDGAPLDLRHFGGIAVASYAVSHPAGTRLTLSAASVPASLIWWSSFQVTSPSPSDPVLPTSLIPRPVLPKPPASERLGRVAAYLRLGQHDLAMAEAAAAWLAGEAAEQTQSATLLIQYFASHPLSRPDTIGAMLAALCMIRDPA